MLLSAFAPRAARAATTLGLLALCGCAATTRFPGPLGPLGRAIPAPFPVSPTVAGPIDDDRGPYDHATDVVKSARYYLDHFPEGFKDDCAGFVCASFGRIGVPLTGNAITFWDAAKQAGDLHHRKLPHAGDIAFFDNTYDRNRNGKPDDELTHVAIVLSVSSDGTILMAHGGSSQGRTTLRMNLLQPQSRNDADGNEINSFLRRQKSTDPSGMKYLASELWKGFATYREADRDIWIGSDATSDAR